MHEENQLCENHKPVEVQIGKLAFKKEGDAHRNSPSIKGVRLIRCYGMR